MLSAHAYKQAEGYNPYHTNAFVTAASATENYATEVNIRKNYFIDFIEVTDGTLTIGYKTEGDITCNWTAFDNFRLYLYTNATVVNISKTSLFFDEASTEQTFTVSGTGLSNNVVLSGPTGISFNPASVTAAEAQAEGGKTVTVTWDPSLLGTKLDGQITVSSIGADSRTINFVTSKDSECVDLLAPAKNLITDPYFNNPVQQGWGAGQGISSENAYCGAYSGKISGTRGGSIDRTVSIASGTACILRAYVKTNNTGFLFGFQPNAYEMAIPNTNEVWELFEANFTATADLTLLYFNNYAANTEV